MSRREWPDKRTWPEWLNGHDLRDLMTLCQDVYDVSEMVVHSEETKEALLQALENLELAVARTRSSLGVARSSPESKT